MISNVKIKIENHIKYIIFEIMREVNYKGDFDDINSFEMAIFANSFVSEYKLGSLYALSNLYFEIFNEVNPFCDYVEIISSFDLEANGKN